MIIENNNRKLIYILCVFIVVLLGTSIYGLFIKKCEECPMCSAVSIKEVEVPPTYQVANYQGTAFKMPLDWNFVDQKDKYAITNKEENIFINIEHYRFLMKNLYLVNIKRLIWKIYKLLIILKLISLVI